MPNVLTTDKRTLFDKNELRSRRLKLRQMSSVIPLDDKEISALASAGMLMPDPYRLLLESDPISRLQASENVRYRVQHTNMLVPPTNVDELLKDDPKLVRIGSKEYLSGEKSMADLMIAVRASAKVLSSFRVAYAEQHALHEELLGLVQERQVLSRMRRSSAPGYLIDFARMLESLGCKRNHLRLVNSKIVVLIREALKLNSGNADQGFDNEAERLQRWLDEDEALSLDDAIDVEDDEFDRLSRIAAKALMDGDLGRAKSAFADLEAYDALIEEGFGADSIDDEDDEGSDADAVADDVLTQIEETAEIPSVVSLPLEGSDIDLGDDVKGASLDAPSPIEQSAPFGASPKPASVPASGPISNPASGPISNPASGPISNPASGPILKPESAPAIKLAPTVGPKVSAPALATVPASELPVSGSELPMVNPNAGSSDGKGNGKGNGNAIAQDAVTPSQKSDAAPAKIEPFSSVVIQQNEDPEALAAEPVMLVDWGERVGSESEHARVDGFGWIAGSDGFGGIVSMASDVSDVIPMWSRKDRPSSTSGVLGLNDWYRFEVPAGNYALVHMPRRIPEFLPVSDNMFPPYIDIERYGEEAGFSVLDMRSLKLASSGRGGIDVAIRAIRAGVVMRYGKDNEDLVRFWAFLLFGRRFAKRIDVLFPDGYFHGVIAPDAGAEQSGVGYFSIVRVLNDRKLSNKIRTPRFPPFDSLELVSSLDGLKL